MDDTLETTPSAPAGRGPVKILLPGVFGFVVPAAIIAIAAYYAVGLLDSRPEAKRKPPARAARLVEVEAIRFGPHRTEIAAMGTVLPARAVTVHARVAGEVTDLGENLVPGGHLGAGDLIVKLDSTDYEILEAQRATEVARVESDLELEKGQQAVARREFEILGESVSDEEKALLLREPQLAIVQARLAAAKSALRRAALDRTRTRVKTPFPALVRERHVDVGSQVSMSTPIAEIVGTDEYWIEVSIPVDRLRWIHIPDAPGETGSTVTIHDESAWGPTASREGTVMRLLGDLEPQGRMARLLVSVRDPLARMKGNEKLGRLLLGAYVRVVVKGRELPSVARIPRDRIRGGDRVWVLTAESRLEIRPVEIVFGTAEAVYVPNGLRTGDRIVVTDLASPVQGMLLRVAAPEKAGTDGPPAPDKTPEGAR
jgi:RND family efflux transporter MFP subunit